MTNKNQKKFYLSEELCDLVDAHPLSNSKVAENALNAYLKASEIAEAEERLDEISREVSEKRSQMNNRRRKVEELEEEREALQARLDRLEEKHEKEQERLAEAIEKLEDVPREPDNPAIQTQAHKLGMAPEELLEELPERDGDGGLRSQ